jgi:transcriptional regulator with XRE-family HTH domain
MSGSRKVGTYRRVAGLRREEVAQLAAISTDYYTRLEQGRISPSAPGSDTGKEFPEVPGV